MATIQEMMLRAQLLRQETALDSISPERAGGIMYDTLAYINQMQLQGANPLLISKIYASVAAMEADSAPVSDLTGQALRPGQVVVIASADSDNGSVYRYNGGTESRWTVVGKIGNLTPVDSLTSDSTQLPLAAHQGKVLDGKVTALGREIGIVNLADLIIDGKIAFETGSIGGTGANADNIYSALRTSGAISTQYRGTISVPDGFEFYYVYYYSVWNSNSDYTLSTRVSIDGAHSLILDNQYNYARILVRNTAHSVVSPVDLTSKLPVADTIKKLEDFDESIKQGFILTETLSPVWKSNGYYLASSTQLQSGSGYYTEAIDIAQYAGKDMVLSVNAITGVSVRACLLADSSNNVLSYIQEKEFVLDPVTGLYTGSLKIPATATRAYLSISTAATASSVLIGLFIGGDNGTEKGVVYVDPQNGNDDNAGTESAPLATFAKAMDITGEETTIIFTGETNERVNVCRKANQRALRIIGKSGRKNRIIRGEKITAATYISGSLYSIALQSFPTDAFFPLFQDGIPDIQTLISNDERLPMQRGREYRCDCSVLLPYSSLEELQASNGLGYYYDSSNLILYFKIAYGSLLSSNPLVIPTKGDSWIYNNNGSVNIELCNIDAYYCFYDLRRCNDAKINNCSVRYCVNAAGFMYDKAVGVCFTKCEACRVFSGSIPTGDGFNAHSTGDSYTTDDPAARTTTAELIDCWAHDCNDDGFSDHERCESVIRGGLYEYNGKGGVTPSFGSHCSCYGVVSRKNSNGFYYIGSATEEEGGKYGQMLCVDCVAENNTIDAGSNYNIHGGFVNSYSTGAGNRVILIGCKSLGNTYGYYNATGNTMELIDCGEMDNTNATSGIIAKKKTTIVE